MIATAPWWAPIVVSFATSLFSVIAGYFHGKNAQINKQSLADLKDQQAK